MIVKKVETTNGTLYNVDISNESIRQFLSEQGIDVLQIAKQAFKEELLQLQNQRVQDVLSQYDYLDMGDLLDTANNSNDPDNTEATAILNWYRAYYTEIDSQVAVIQGKQKIDTLLQLDLKAMEEQAFQNSIQSNPLP